MRSVSILGFWILIAVVWSACSEVDTSYFRSRVDAVTYETVAHRYGAPHRIEHLPNGRSVWTYFERGSGTASYAGSARGRYCHAYLLTFDDQTGVLKDWRQEDCRDEDSPVNEPASDRTR
jgi:hypothetical protein